MNFEFMTIDTLLPPCMPFPRALTGFPVSSTAKVMYCRIWKPTTARSGWISVLMKDRGLILSLLSMRGLLSDRWKSVVSRLISAT